MLFSIIIPTYNRAEFIGKTIQSFLDQTFEDFELIVVDDGSTDSTEDVVISFKDHRIRYYKKENAERGAARNFGAAKAQGRYLNFFDSDDTAYGLHLKTATEFIDNKDSPEVFHLNYDIKEPSGNILIHKRRIYNINRQLVQGNILSCNGVFIRRDIFDSIKFSETRALSGSEDYLLWLRLSFDYIIHHVDIVTSTIMDHESRSVIKTDVFKLIERKSQLNLHLIETCSNSEYFKQMKNIIKCNSLLYVSLHLALLGERKKSLKYLWQAFKTHAPCMFSMKTIVICKKLLIK